MHPSKSLKKKQQNNSKSSCGLDQWPNIENRNVSLNRSWQRGTSAWVETHCDGQAMSRRDPDASWSSTRNCVGDPGSLRSWWIRKDANSERSVCEGEKEEWQDRKAVQDTSIYSAFPVTFHIVGEWKQLVLQMTLRRIEVLLRKTGVFRFAAERDWRL